MSVENLKKFALKLGQTRNFITNETVAILNKNEKLIADMNREQMAKSPGLGADGHELGYGYTEMSAYIRESEGLQTDFVDFKHTGDFHKSIFAESYSDGKTPFIDIDATDYKWTEAKISESKTNPYGLKKQNPEALGLIEKNRDKVGGIIARELSQRISKFWKI